MHRLGRKILRLWFWLVLASLLWTWGDGNFVWAQSTGSPPTTTVLPAQKRLIHQFHFDERELGNYEDLPMHWYIMGRAPQTSDPQFQNRPLHAQLVRQLGYPTFNPVNFDAGQKVSGKLSLYMGLNGGNTGVFLEYGTIKAIPQSDYQITAFIRTTDLRHARAKLIAYFMDAQGRRIDASTARTEPIKAFGKWESVGVKLRGDFPDAAWIGLQLELCQPDPQAGQTLGKFEVLYQDIQGGAWFDDISIWQVPRIVLDTQNPINVIRAPERPRIITQVRDLAGQGLVADLRIYDADRQLVAQTRQTIGNGQPMDNSWTPPLDRLGWYLADMTLYDLASTRSGGSSKTHQPMPIARTFGAFLWLADEPAIDPAHAARFLLDATDLSPSDLELVPLLMEQSRLGAVALSCWDRQTTKATMDDRQMQLDRVLEPLVQKHRQVTLSLSPLPVELASIQEPGVHNPLALLQAQPQSWNPYLAPVLMRHGQHVHRWQLGPVTQADAFYLPKLPSLLTAITKDFLNMAPQPTMVLPWQLNQARRQDMAERPIYAIDVPPSVQPDYLLQHTQTWNKKPQADFLLYLRSPDAVEMTHTRRIEDMARRMIHGWESGAGALAITRPWGPHVERPGQWLPDPLLGVFSAIAPRLAGRKVVGRLKVAEGVECLIFDGPRGGMLAVWADRANPKQAQLHMDLGGRPVLVDVWGQASPVPTVDGLHHVKLTSQPVFIEGVDPALAMFRAGYQFEPAFLPSLQTPHPCTITITNPWSRTINGHMIFTDPKSWSIEPSRTSFSIASGQTLRIPVQVRFPASELAGRKDLVARFDFTAEQRYVIDLSTPLELGLMGVKFDASLSLETDPKTGKADAVVTQMVTNTSDHPTSLYAFANLPGFPRQERLIPRLEPGQTIVRRFRFPDAGAALSQADIRVGLRETSGPAILNKMLSIRDPHR